ncbi:hypothetical protein Gpo141_00007575 [Globisporangium polare]
MFTGKSLAVLAVAGLASTAANVSAQTYLYEFDPTSAAGVKGTVKVDYASANSSKAVISANLDFSKLDLAGLQKLEGNCTTEPTEYKWHIHVKWNSTKSSEALAGCSKAATSNHYDPLFACGPNSEYAEQAQCAGKTATYACSPANYTSSPLSCEKGDLSGKFGGFKLDGNKTVVGNWTDVNYPLVSENTAQWNIILHAVCANKTTPRLACALGKAVTLPPSTPAPTTVKPSTPAPTTVKPSTPAPTTAKPAATKAQC